MDRPNLTVLTHALVSRVTFEGRRANGVEIVYNGKTQRIADGSIMPRATACNTMAPCVIIGERAGEMLKADHKL
jgi:choline dehydrogenase-like flavoprotein